MSNKIRRLKLSAVILFFIVVPCFSAEKESEFVYNSHDKKDPFTAYVAEVEGTEDVATLSDMRLEGIIWDENKPIAVINDKVMAVGDVIDGAVIKEIKQNEVVFEVNGQKSSIKLTTNEGDISPEQEKI